jgi:hypothetical protein
MVQMDSVPEGIKEKVGSALGAPDRRVKGDPERFKDMIEAARAAPGAGRSRGRADARGACRHAAGGEDEGHVGDTEPATTRTGRRRRPSPSAHSLLDTAGAAAGLARLAVDGARAPAARALVLSARRAARRDLVARPGLLWILFGHGPGATHNHDTGDP